jgi:20S proteasome subunit alpha 5
LTLVEAERLAISVLKQVMEEKITAVNVEVAIVPAATAQYTLRSDEEIEALLQEVGSNAPAQD